MSSPRRFDNVAAILLAAIAVAAGVAVITVGVCGVYHDDGVYVSTAKALAEGRGYRLINLPAAPLQTRYPILYPAGLALIWRVWPVFPQNLIAMQSLSLLSGAAAIGLGYLYAVRVQGCRRMTAALGMALCATAPTFAYFSTQTLSEIPFAVGLIVALWIVAEEQTRPTTSRAREGLVGLALAIPCLLRLVGLVIVVPMLYALWRHNRRILWYAIGALLPLAAWMGWVWSARHATATIRVAMNSPDSWDWLVQIMSRGVRHTVGYNALIVSVATADLFPASWKAHVAIAFPALGLMIWIAVVRRGRFALAPVLLAYVLVILLWPWPPSRFLVPLWPILGPFAMEPIQRRLGSVAMIGIAAAAIGGNLRELHQTSQRSHALHYPTSTTVKTPSTWSAYERLFGFIRVHTDPGDVLITGLDPMLFLYTGRPAIRAFDVQPLPLFYGVTGNPVGTIEDLVALLTRRNGQYLVQTPMPGFAEEEPFNNLVTQLRREHPTCVSQVYQDEQDPRFVIWAIDIAGCNAVTSSTSRVERGGRVWRRSAVGREVTTERRDRQVPPARADLHVAPLAVVG